MTRTGNELANFRISLYHTTPDSNWLKADIQDWLSVHDISYTNSETKSQLLEKIND